MTGKVRLADVPSEILNVPTMNGRFAQERTVMKNAAMSESRTKRSFALGGDLRTAEIYEGHTAKRKNYSSGLKADI